MAPTAPRSPAPRHKLVPRLERRAALHIARTKLEAHDPSINPVRPSPVSRRIGSLRLDPALPHARLRPRALLLRRRRSPQRGSPRPLHSFLPFPLPASPHIRARPRVRGEGIRPAQRSGIRAAASGARRRGAGGGGFSNGRRSSIRGRGRGRRFCAAQREILSASSSRSHCVSRATCPSSLC